MQAYQKKPSFNKLRKLREAQETPTATPNRRAFKKCPRCKYPLKRTLALNQGYSEFWLECSNPRCNTYVNTYIPQSHQADFHKDAHRFKGSFGGYGTGKTLTDREEFYKHMFITPGGNGLIGANIVSQFDATIKRDVENDLPQAFVAHQNTQKNYIDFVNGYRLMFRPFDDPDKLRSLNLDFFLILEASEVKAEAYTQLKTRIRNLSATKPKRDEHGDPMFKYTREGVPIPILDFDWRQGIIESNPDSGWIKSEHLLFSDEIKTYGTLKDLPRLDETKKDAAISSYIVASDCNAYLPPNFINDLKRNKPVWWVARYVEGSFLYAEGRVYPSAMKVIVPSYQIPRHWKRLLAHDYGLVDPSVFLMAAIDEQRGKLVVYRDVRTKEKNLEQLASLFYRVTKDVPVGGWARSPIIDPKSGAKRDYDKTSLSAHYLDYGISFKPGAISVDARIVKLNTYIESGRLEIMDSCVDLIQELQDYKFPSARNSTTQLVDKPQDKDNHSINCLEWVVMELPADPRDITHGAWNAQGDDLISSPMQRQRAYANTVFEDAPRSHPGSIFEVDYTFGG